MVLFMVMRTVNGIFVVSMGTTSKAEMSFRAVTDAPALADL